MTAPKRIRFLGTRADGGPSGADRLTSGRRCAILIATGFPRDEPRTAARVRVRGRAPLGRALARDGARPRGGPAAAARAHRQPLGAALVQARGGPPAAPPPPHVPPRPRRRGGLAGPESPPSRARGRRRGAALHEREHAPRAQDAPRDAAPRHERPRLRPRRGVRGHQRPVLRLAPASSHHVGPRRRPRPAGWAHLRELRPGARPHPHPSRPRPSRRAPILPGERRAPRDAPPPHGRHARPRGTHRVPHAGLPRGGGALPPPPGGAGLGEGRTSPSCCVRATRSTESAGRHGPPRARPGASPAG